MLHMPKDTNFELMCFIINTGHAHKLIQAARQWGVLEATVLLGRGTANNKILDFLGLADVRKEIVLMVTKQDIADKVLQDMNKKFSFEKPNHGIAFTTSVGAVLGSRSLKSENTNCERGIKNIMYHSITVIVDKGKAEDVIDAATKAGAKGGTIINARGSGVHETSKVFSMEIEPEKEIVIILSETERTQAIVNSITEELKIDEPGKGIIYVQDVNQAYGIYK